MAANVAVTYTYVNGTAADGTQVNQNFTDIVNWVNTNAVHLDGSKPFTGAPSYAADPVSANQLCRKSYVDGYLGGFIFSVAKLRRAAAVSVPTGVATNISWDTEDSDSYGFITAPSATVTIPVGHGGFYAIYGTLTWASNPGPASGVTLTFTGGYSMSVGSGAASVTTEYFDASGYLAAGATVTVQAVQNTAGAINLNSATLVLRRISD